MKRDLGRHTPTVQISARSRHLGRCIPAVLSDPVTFPYERFIDYTALTVKLPEQWAPNLTAKLRAIPKSAVGQMRRGLVRTRPAFLYEDGCALQMLLIELAARKHGFFKGAESAAKATEARPPATLNGIERFWLPSGSFELRGATKVGPSWGAAAVPH